MSWVTLRESHTWEDIKSPEFIVKKKIVLSESVDETGLFHEYFVSKHIKVKCEIWNGMKWNHQRMNAGKTILAF
jgi:hypothetical protein